MSFSGESIVSIVQENLSVFFDTCREIHAHEATQIKDLALHAELTFFWRYLNKLQHGGKLPAGIVDAEWINSIHPPVMNKGNARERLSNAEFATRIRTIRAIIAQRFPVYKDGRPIWDSYSVFNALRAEILAKPLAASFDQNTFRQARSNAMQYGMIRSYFSSSSKILFFQP